jgi:microcompartment protein CcmK/EutM
VRRGGPAPLSSARAIAAALAAALLVVAYLSLPYFIARESLKSGLTTSIETGERDWVFYRRGWSARQTHGAVTARVIVGDQAIIRFPIPVQRTYRLTLRADPATPDMPKRVVLWLNGRLLFPFGLGLNPDRVGAYTVEVSADQLRSGDNELKLVADGTVPAASAGDRFAWLPKSTPVSLRVWYIRLEPS